MQDTDNDIPRSVGVWRELEAELALVTPEQIAAAETRLDDEIRDFNVIGTIAEDDVLRRVRVLIEHYAREYRQGVETLEAAGSDEERDRSPCEMRMSKNRVEVLNRTFWAEFGERFPELAPRAQIGICRGWKVGWVEEEAPVSVATAVFIPPELVSLLMGGAKGKGN